MRVLLSTYLYRRIDCIILPQIQIEFLQMIQFRNPVKNLF